jgi:antitoxin Phd
MKAWQLQEAKMRFSELVKQAVNLGPQQITVRGKTTAVLISKEEYDRLVKPKISFVDFLRKSPLVGLDIELKINRDKSKTRDIDL